MIPRRPSVSFVVQRAASGGGYPITGTGPVLAALTDGDTLSDAVTWGSYSSPVGAVSTTKEMREGSGEWTAYNGSTAVSEGETWQVRETASDGFATRVFSSQARTVAEAPAVPPTVTNEALDRDGTDDPELVFDLDLPGLLYWRWTDDDTPLSAEDIANAADGSQPVAAGSVGVTMTTHPSEGEFWLQFVVSGEGGLSDAFVVGPTTFGIFDGIWDPLELFDGGTYGGRLYEVYRSKLYKDALGTIAGQSDTVYAIEDRTGNDDSVQADPDARGVLTENGIKLDGVDDYYPTTWGAKRGAYAALVEVYWHTISPDKTESFFGLLYPATGSPTTYTRSQIGIRKKKSTGVDFGFGISQLRASASPPADKTFNFYGLSGGIEGGSAEYSSLTSNAAYANASDPVTFNSQYERNTAPEVPIGMIREYKDVSGDVTFDSEWGYGRFEIVNVLFIDRWLTEEEVYKVRDAWAEMRNRVSQRAQEQARREALLDLIAQSSANDVITIPGGDYGEITWKNVSAPGITLVNDDDAPGAVFRRLSLTNCEGIIFDGCVVDAVDPVNCLSMSGCTDVWFNNGLLQGIGPDESGYLLAGNGYGLLNNTRCGIEGTEITGSRKGGSFAANTGGGIIDCHIHHNGLGDAIQTEGNHWSTFRGNLIHDFVDNPIDEDHTDGLQIYNSSRGKSTNITIESNTIDIGTGRWSQSLFLTNERMRGANPDMNDAHTGLVVRNNLIINTHTHGISLGGTIGALVENNTLLVAPEPDANAPSFGKWTSINVDPSENWSFTVSDNVAPNTLSDLSSDGNTRSGNVQASITPGSANWFGDQFIYSTFWLEDGLHRPINLPGGAIDVAGAGSTLCDIANHPDKARFHVTGTGLTRTFDAGYSFSEGWPAGATVDWDWGDGSAHGSGVTDSHSYASAGTYNVTMTITLQDSSTLIRTAPVIVW